MGMNAVEVKVMPESIETDLEKIKSEIQKKLKKAKNIKIEEKEIAFGLKALQLLIAWPDTEDTDEIENLLNTIEGVSSCQIEEIRRAFG
ncbi:MAG: elongation factor 1-beta [Nanoarchaeota archaeon]|nr:elongation factor 1-beta [Nanoarchaeota archaeon]